MKRRFQELDAADDAAEKPRARGTGFTDQELESRFSAPHASESSEQLFDEETMRRMMKRQRAEEEATAKGLSPAKSSTAVPVASTAEPVSESRRKGRDDVDLSAEIHGYMSTDTTPTPPSRPQTLGPSVGQEASTTSPSTVDFGQGDIVSIKGLKAAAHLNGERGRLGQLDSSTGRWEVMILSSGDTKAIKPDNLDLESRRPASQDIVAEEMFVPPPSPDQTIAPQTPPQSAKASSAAARAGAGGVAGLSSAAMVNAPLISTQSSASTAAAAAAKRKTTRRQGTVRWYNGRRKIGKIIPDDSRAGKPDLFIPAQGALNGSQVPPQPGGLFHGTRVSFIPSEIKDDFGKKTVVCMDVRPLPGQVGLTVGVDTNIGAKETNDDKLAACDLNYLGFLAGVFDGHRGPLCAEYVAKQLPAQIHASYKTQLKRQPGASVMFLSSEKEANLISSAMTDAFEAVDKAFLVNARKKDLNDGSTGVVALICHGFEAPAPVAGQAPPSDGGAASLWSKVAKKLGQEDDVVLIDEPAPAAPARPAGTVPVAPGGIAKLFVAWCGDSRAVLIRGRQGLRCTEDHRPNRKDEMARCQKAGGFIGKDARGVWRVGPKEDNKFARELKGKKKDTMSRWFLATSRAFGDKELKVPDPIITATPDVKVLDLMPEDWAVVLCSDGITDALSDQQIANVIFKAMALQGKDPVAAAKLLVQTALGGGSKDNLTAIVMRFNWANPPSANAAAPGDSASTEEVSMFG